MKCANVYSEYTLLYIFQFCNISMTSHCFCVKSEQIHFFPQSIGQTGSEIGLKDSLVNNSEFELIFRNPYLVIANDWRGHANSLGRKCGTLMFLCSLNRMFI